MLVCPWSNARIQLRMFPLSPASVNLLPPERNREAMDDDELIAALASGDDTALRELFARHAPAGGHEPVHRPDAAAVRSRLRGRGQRIRQPGSRAVQAALLRGAGIPFAAQPKPVAAAENLPGRALGTGISGILDWNRGAPSHRIAGMFARLWGFRRRVVRELRLLASDAILAFITVNVVEPSLLRPNGRYVCDGGADAVGRSPGPIRPIGSSPGSMRQAHQQQASDG